MKTLSIFAIFLIAFSAVAAAPAQSPSTTHTQTDRDASRSQGAGRERSPRNKLILGYLNLMLPSEVEREAGAFVRDLGKASVRDLKITVDGFCPVCEGGIDTFLTPAPGHEMWGVLYEVTPAQFAAIARAEFHPRYLHWAPVKAKLADGRVVDAFASVSKKRDPRGAGKLAGVDKAIAGAKLHQIPGAYIAEIERLQ